MKHLNEYKHTDFPDFSIKFENELLIYDAPDNLIDLICNYIFDLDNGLNQKLHSEHVDEEDRSYDLITEKDIIWYSDLVGYGDVVFPSWIESFNIFLYMDKNEDYDGYVPNIMNPDKNNWEYNRKTDKLKIKKLAIFVSGESDLYTTMVHEFTHCYDLYKKFSNNFDFKKLSTSDVYSLTQDDLISMWGNYGDDIKDLLKNNIPEKYKEYKNKFWKLLNNPDEFSKIEDPYMLLYVIGNIFYYLDMFETKAFYVMVKNKKFINKYNEYKELYQNISNLISILNRPSENLVQNFMRIRYSEFKGNGKNIITPCLEYVYKATGIGSGVSKTIDLKEWLWELQLEFKPEIKDILELFEKND